MQIMLRALCWLPMLIIFPHTEERNCSISSSTIEYTSSCPKNLEEWQAREKIKKCENVIQHCTEKEYFRYHCVRNAFMNSTLEVCAPIWYSSGFCIEFNTDGERIQDNYDINCTHFATACPSTYISTDIYKYPECYSTINETGNDSRSCDEKNCTTLNSILPVQTTILITVSSVVFILALSVVIAFCIRKRRKQNRFGFKDTSAKPPKIVQLQSIKSKDSSSKLTSSNGMIFYIRHLCDDGKSLPSESSRWDLNTDSIA